MSAVWVLAVVGSVAAFTVLWCAHHVRKEHQRRQQVASVRAELVHRPTVAELRERCQADAMPRYPKSPAALDSASAWSRGDRRRAPLSHIQPGTATADADAGPSRTNPEPATPRDVAGSGRPQVA